MQIMEQRAQLRSSLKISFNGIKLSGDRSIGSYCFEKNSKLALLFKHSSLMPQGGYLQNLDYGELLSSFL